MTIIKNLSTKNFKHTYFSLSISEQPRSIFMRMELNHTFVTTADIPCVQKILQEKIPGIFSTKCFNYKHQSFYKEVKNTELAHLFEHIILEKYCELKAQNGFKKFTIRGNTEWDWYTFPRGTFFVRISLHKRDRELFYTALSQSIEIYDYIINHCVLTHTHKTPSTLPQYGDLAIA